MCQSWLSDCFYIYEGYFKHVKGYKFRIKGEEIIMADVAKIAYNDRGQVVSVHVEKNGKKFDIKNTYSEGGKLTEHSATGDASIWEARPAATSSPETRSPSTPTAYGGNTTNPGLIWTGGPTKIPGDYMQRQNYSYAGEDLTDLPNIDTRALLEKARMGTNYMRAVNEGGVLCNLFRTPPVEARNLGAILNAGMPAVPDFSGCTARVIEAPPIAPPVATAATPTTPTPPTAGTPVATTPGETAKADGTKATIAKIKAELEADKKAKAQQGIDDAAKLADETNKTKAETDEQQKQAKIENIKIAENLSVATDGGFWDVADQAKVEAALQEVKPENVIEIMDIYKKSQVQNLGSAIFEASRHDFGEIFNHPNRNKNFIDIAKKLQERAESTGDKETIEMATANIANIKLKLAGFNGTIGGTYATDYTIETLESTADKIRNAEENHPKTTSTEIKNNDAQLEKEIATEHALIEKHEGFLSILRNSNVDQNDSTFVEVANTLKSEKIQAKTSELARANVIKKSLEKQGEAIKTTKTYTDLVATIAGLEKELKELKGESN